jgi:hypothetical protein
MKNSITHSKSEKCWGEDGETREAEVGLKKDAC